MTTEPDRRELYRREYYLKHRAALLAYGRAWHWAHRVKRLQQMREYYSAHRAEVLARRKAIRDAERVGTLRWWKQHHTQPAEYAEAYAEQKRVARSQARRELYRLRKRHGTARA